MKKLSVDVGTRTVVGLVTEYNDGKLVVHHMHMQEHEERAMLDGAIHDIGKVASVVEDVVKKLEEESGQTFDEVDVALAGRSLKTMVGESELDISKYPEITFEEVKNVEMMAVKDAISALGNNEDMYCVGYSVLYHKIDGEWIKNPVGHRGKRLWVKVMATFLPRQIVDSMVTTMKRVGLSISHFTLEPIAVMNAVVPPDLRLLNIALLDVGAGTSDIAISRDGTIHGYGMVTSAGDEITEEICRRYLLDFQTAEFVKRNLNSAYPVKVRNILGVENEIEPHRVLADLREAMDGMAREIGSKILELNGFPPAAVIVVGGGAKLPGFTSFLARHLDLPESRISLRDAASLNFVDDRTGKLQGSEFVTPLAIAHAGHTSQGGIFITVTLNGKPVQLLPMGSKRTVMDLMLQNGARVEDLIAKPSPSIVFEVNGRIHIHRGMKGEDAPVFINGERASLRSTVEHGDIVEVGSPTPGKTIPPKIREVMDPIFVEVENDRVYEVYPEVRLNGRVVDVDTEIHDSDRVEFETRMTVKEVLERLPVNTINVIFNDRSVEIPIEEYTTDEPPDREIELGHRIHVRAIERQVRVKDLLNNEEPQESVKVFFNGRPVELKKSRRIVRINGALADEDAVLQEGDVVEMKIEQFEPTVVDLLAYETIDSSRIRDYKILVNGSPASFVQVLNDGDKVELILEESRWKSREWE